MKAFILNGIDKQSETAKIYEMVINELQNIAIIIESIDLLDIEFASCQMCYHCWTKTPGNCVLEDEGNEIAQELMQADIVVILTPTNGEGELSALIKKAMKRTIPNLANKKKTNSTLIGIGVACGSADRDASQFYKTIERLGIDFRYIRTASELICTNESLEDQQERVEETFAIGVKNF